MSKELKQKVRFHDWLRDLRAAAPADDEIAARIEAVGEMIAETEDLKHQLGQQSHELYRYMAAAASKRLAEKGQPPLANALDNDSREDSSIELVFAEAGPCVECGHEVGKGMIGWSREADDPGPLCDRCFGEHNVDLAAVVAVVDGLRQIVAGSQEPEGGPDAVGAAFNLARLYAQVTFGTWPLRPTGVTELREDVQDMMEERHGRYWVSELERAGGTGEGEPN